MTPDNIDDLTRKARQFDAVRQSLGILGLGLPASLLGYSAITGTAVAESISAYYHTAMGDVLVGALWAIGVFLLAYLGYDQTAIERASPRLIDKISDRAVARVAGLASICVALFPVHGDQCSAFLASVTVTPASLACPVSGFTPQTDLVHYSAAAVFFTCMWIFCLILFPRGGGTKDNLRTTARGTWRPTDWSGQNRLFLICGLAIIGSLAALSLYALADWGGATGITRWLDQRHVFLGSEVTAILAFSAAWLEKGKVRHTIAKAMSAATG